jgi:hypothetical protein
MTGHDDRSILSLISVVPAVTPPVGSPVIVRATTVIVRATTVIVRATTVIVRTTTVIVRTTTVIVVSTIGFAEPILN